MSEVFGAILATIPAWGIVSFMWFSNYGPGGQR